MLEFNNASIGFDNFECMLRNNHNGENKRGPSWNALKLHLIVMLQDKALDTLQVLQRPS
jgi:hypothetical protein